MLYPIRINASSNNQSARLIDSILIDPSCLPIPSSSALQGSYHHTTNIYKDDADLSPVNSINQNRKRKRNNHHRLTPIERTVLKNSSYLATTLLADMEVLGVSRKDKSTRASLLVNPGLKERVEDQIRQQLRVILSKEEVISSSGIDSAEGIGSDGDSTKESKEEEKAIPPSPNPNLVNVKIRLRQNGISIIDEFAVDPHHSSSNPLTLAQSLAYDMNLPMEVVNSIAISIVEQIAGLEVRAPLEGMLCNNDDLDICHCSSASHQLSAASPFAASVRKREIKREVPTAWVMDEKEKNIARSIYLDILQPKDKKDYV